MCFFLLWWKKNYLNKSNFGQKELVLEHTSRLWFITLGEVIVVDLQTAGCTGLKK